MTGSPYYIVLVWHHSSVQLMIRHELPTLEEVKELVTQYSCKHGTVFGTGEYVPKEVFTYAHP